METLTLPDSVTVIDRGAFHDCNRLGSMTVPASVAKIGGGAFFNCGELTEVTMLGERPEAPNDIFNKNWLFRGLRKKFIGISRFPYPGARRFSA